MAKSIGSMILVALITFGVTGNEPTLITYVGNLGVFLVNYWGMMDMDKAKNESSEEILELNTLNNNLIIEKDGMRTTYDKKILELNAQISNLTYENEYLKKLKDVKP